MRRRLTNLENVALAQLGKIGPVTAYQVRKAFAQSSSGRYSGSAGAIYPLLRRLENDGLVRAAKSANGDQEKQLYSLTRAGRRAVKAWLFDLEPEEIFPDDPLRTRFQFLQSLSTEDRKRWIESAIEAVSALDRAVMIEYGDAAYDNEIDQHVLKGVTSTNNNRKRWLRAAPR